MAPRFTTLRSRAVVLPTNDIDTDQIIPARFLKTTDKAGLGASLFSDWRYGPDGAPRPGFPLNAARAKGCEILVAGDNFGCGSSREHAPWALMDYGFRAVIGPSFGDIFLNNCLKNGLLPVVLSETDVDRLFHACQATPGFALSVDLERQSVTTADGAMAFGFDIEPFSKHCLLNGLDEVGLTLEHADEIRAFESRHLAKQPWLV
jgi:3-isopropylmalate/(R)-2-methylmalate dehydratase small subunit